MITMFINSYSHCGVNTKMAQQIPNRRSALAEIPLRMGMLRVSTEDINDLGTLMDSPVKANRFR